MPPKTPKDTIEIKFEDEILEEGEPIQLKEKETDSEAPPPMESILPLYQKEIYNAVQQSLNGNGRIEAIFENNKNNYLIQRIILGALGTNHHQEEDPEKLREYIALESRKTFEYLVGADNKGALEILENAGELSEEIEDMSKKIPRQILYLIIKHSKTISEARQKISGIDLKILNKLASEFSSYEHIYHALFGLNPVEKILEMRELTKLNGEKYTFPEINNFLFGININDDVEFDRKKIAAYQKTCGIDELEQVLELLTLGEKGAPEKVGNLPERYRSLKNGASILLSMDIDLNTAAAYASVIPPEHIAALIKNGISPEKYPEEWYLTLEKCYLKWQKEDTGVDHEDVDFDPMILIAAMKKFDSPNDAVKKLEKIRKKKRENTYAENEHGEIEYILPKGFKGFTKLRPL